MPLWVLIPPGSSATYPTGLRPCEVVPKYLEKFYLDYLSYPENLDKGFTCSTRLPFSAGVHIRIALQSSQMGTRN